MTQALAVPPRRPQGLASDAEVLAFALAELEAGRAAALATIVGLDGPFSRPLGAQLAVAADGRWAGGVSGGCLETAVTEAAVAALEAGANRTLRFGRDSPFVDVRLPCGGGVDLFVDVGVDPETLAAAVALDRKREPFRFEISTAGPAPAMRLAGPGGEAPSGRIFVRRYAPRPRLLLVGRGWELVALARLGAEAGCEIVAASQEEATLDLAAPHAVRTIRLTTPQTVPPLPIDAFTAVACLFHEHEWEAGVLLDALRSPAFHVGALGSRETHRRRVETLRELGAGPEDVARLKAPIGLFPARDPVRLAVATLAEALALAPVAVSGWA